MDHPRAHHKLALASRKEGFKSAFAPAEDETKVDVKKEDDADMADEKRDTGAEDSDLTDDEDYYDPRRPTGCMPGCHGYAAAGS